MRSSLAPSTLKRSTLKRSTLSSSLTRTACVLGLLGLANACQCDEEVEALPGTIEGVVCHPDNGRPVGNITILVSDIDNNEITTTDTDAFGVWSSDQIPPGDVVITTLVGDDLPREWEVRVLSGEVVTIEDEQCRAPPPPPPPALGSIEGCVCDDGVGWVVEANVFVTTSTGFTFATGTNDRGCFTLDDVPVGEQLLSIHGIAGFERDYDVTVLEDETVALDSPDDCDVVEPEPIPEPTPDPVAETGNIQGRVCAPDGETWLSAAEVFFDIAGGGRIDTVTDAAGNYLLEGLPTGTQTIRVRKGSFESSFEADIPANDTLVIPDEQCEIEQNIAIAVVDGLWDDVRSVLINVGIDQAQIVDIPAEGAGPLLADYASLAQYDIIFFNCGLNETSYLDDAVHAENLRAFVEAGGSVYASDQAYDVVEKAFPEYVEFYGDDTVVNAAQRGATMDSVNANVSDLGLAIALGSNTIELHYPLGAWSVMESVSDAVRIYIRGDALVGLGVTGVFTTTLPDVPHTVGFEVGQGNVIYTSFHQEPGINATMERVLQILVFEL